MTRTCDLLVRSQTLYPTELRARGDTRQGTSRGIRTSGVENADGKHVPTDLQCTTLRPLRRLEDPPAKRIDGVEQSAIPRTF